MSPYHATVKQIRNLPWESLTPEELQKLMVLSAHAAREFGESLRVALDLNPDNEDLKEIIQNPNIIKNSICIIEPADHVGKNLIGEDVRASSNIASLCQFISDCDAILIPLWKTGKLDNKLLIHVLENSLAVFVEGGHPTVKDANSFKDLNISLDELQELN